MSAFDQSDPTQNPQFRRFWERRDPFFQRSREVLPPPPPIRRFGEGLFDASAPTPAPADVRPL